MNFASFNSKVDRIVGEESTKGFGNPAKFKRHDDPFQGLSKKPRELVANSLGF